MHTHWRDAKVRLSYIVFHPDLDQAIDPNNILGGSMQGCSNSELSGHMAFI